MATVESGRELPLEVNGETIVLAPSDVLIEAVQREGYAAMAGDGYLVALDTELSRELIAERLAREVIRRVNDWRKAAGLNVEDRILLRYEATPELEEAILAHREYIMGETLANEFGPGEPTGQGYRLPRHIRGPDIARRVDSRLRSGCEGRKLTRDSTNRKVIRSTP